MYTSYNAYNHCDACQPTYLGEKIEIIRQQTADLREKMIYLEEHFNNQNRSMSPISTTFNNDSKSSVDKMYSCSYCPQVYPIAMPQYYHSQYDQLESLAPLSPLDPAPISPSQEPDSLRYAQIQNTENHRPDTTITENWESKADTSQLNNTDYPIVMNAGNKFHADTSTTSQGECKEMLQLCLTLINDLRDARTELATIVNKCLESHPKLDKELLCQLCSVKEDNEKSFVGRKPHRVSEDKKKILNETSSKERKVNGYYPSMDKKINKVIREEKLTKKQELDGNEDGEKDAVLTILINCLEAIKVSREGDADVEGTHVLGRKIKIESGCKCNAEKKKSKFCKKEKVNGSSCFFDKSTLSKCLCFHQAAAPSPLLPAEPHELQSKPCTCTCDASLNEPAMNNQSVVEAEKVNFTEVKPTAEGELTKVTELTEETENKGKHIKNDDKSKEKHNGKGEKEREEEKQVVNDEAKEKIEETEKPKVIEESGISGKTVVISSKDTCSCPTNGPEANMDNGTKLVALQEYSGGCCCQGERQQFCKCGPYLDPPCGRESITVTRKCTNKSGKAAKETKPGKPKSKHRKRPCFHTWPERTRCLKRCIDHPRS